MKALGLALHVPHHHSVQPLAFSSGSSLFPSFLLTFSGVARKDSFSPARRPRRRAPPLRFRPLTQPSTSPFKKKNMPRVLFSALQSPPSPS